MPEHLDECPLCKSDAPCSDWDQLYGASEAAGSSAGLREQSPGTPQPGAGLTGQPFAMKWRDRVNRIGKPPAVSRQLARPKPPSDREQLRRDPSAGFVRDRKGWAFAERTFFVGSGCPPVLLSPERLAKAQRIQPTLPFPMTRVGSRVWWWFEGAFYWENAGLEPSDVVAMVRHRERTAQKRLERAHLELELEQHPLPRRAALTRDMKRAVFERDGGACAECGSNFDLQYDHILPVALGGATTVENLQLLCSQCNQVKGKSL